MDVEKCEVCGQLFCSPETVAERDHLRAEKAELIAALRAIERGPERSIEGEVFGSTARSIARAALAKATAA
jgi:hypothetical protein